MSREDKFSSRKPPQNGPSNPYHRYQQQRNQSYTPQNVPVKFGTMKSKFAESYADIES